MPKIPEELILEQIQLGPLQNFLYFVGDARSKEIAVVDPAWDVPHLCATAAQNDWAITKVLLTHGHPDHVNGLDEILSQHNVPAYISSQEAPFLKPNHKNIVEIEDKQKLMVGNIEFECILTPGHTPGGICYKYKNVLIAGDTIFIDGCGRCDLPGGDARQMYKSLQNIIMKLPDDTLLFTGHNYGPAPYATVGEQKKTNPYLTAENEADFLQHRMGLSL